MLRLLNFLDNKKISGSLAPAYLLPLVQRYCEGYNKNQYVKQYHLFDLLASRISAHIFVCSLSFLSASYSSRSTRSPCHQ